MTELDLRKAICEAGRRLYAKNLVAATDGNISVRLGSGRFLCTPSGVSKGFMAVNDLIVADAKGNKLSGDGKVTSEFTTHLAAYEERPDMNAVVHAHPPKALGFTIAGVSLADCVLPEVIYTIGGIPTADYATPATPEGAVAIRELIRKCDALMMDRHGALTVGVTVFDALFKMEKIEHASESLLIARLLGRVRQLEGPEIEKLYKVREAYGVSGVAYKCSDGCTTEKTDERPNESELDRVIVETLGVLGRG
ncbi:MAG TPA: class II aldolase/adducin family protein [Candidatus Hydrogenedentes bacterium]|nr:class II aldolase/adducin family protein [Candidatus Hydrogenedentota bacterium]HRK34601.1 class II aldolase/adducin family protein [Candidatus Hydrogenedentota bacterium]